MNTTTIHISNIIDSQRIDVSYFKETSGTDRFVPLSKYVEVKGGKRIPKGESFSFENTNYLYLRLSEITDPYNIDYTALKNISEDLFNTLHRYEITNNQVVFSIAGTIGRVFTIKNIPQGKRVILTENCAKLQPKDGKILPDFISILLGCDFVQQQIGQNRIKTTIPKIGLDRIAKLKVPELPSLKKQQEIVDIYSNAQKERLKKKREAEQLLDGIDDYLFSSLQIEKPQRSTPNRLSQKQNVSSIIGGRLDPLQFHIERTNMIDRIKQVRFCRLKDVVINSKSIVKELANNDIYIGLENIDGKTGEYNPLTEKESVSSAAVFCKGNILFPKLRPYLNKVHRVQFDGCCSTEFHVFEARNIHPEFLTIVLRSKMILAQTKHLMTGNTLPRLQTTDIENLIIPYPDIETQEKIVAHVTKIKEQAKQLQKEGDISIEKTKQKIENLLIQ